MRGLRVTPDAASDTVRCMHTTSPSNSPEWNSLDFARTVKALRQWGYSATALADRAGVSRSQVSRWGSGAHRPGYESIRRLAESIVGEAPLPDVLDLVVDLCRASGYPGIAADLGLTETPDAPPATMISPYTGDMWRIVRSLQQRAEAAGLTPEEEREAIEAVMRRAEESMERDLDVEVYRRREKK